MTNATIFAIIMQSMRKTTVVFLIDCIIARIVFVSNGLSLARKR